MSAGEWTAGHRDGSLLSADFAVGAVTWGVCSVCQGRAALPAWLGIAALLTAGWARFLGHPALSAITLGLACPLLF